jgi:hypothetical protein
LHAQEFEARQKQGNTQNKTSGPTGRSRRNGGSSDKEKSGIQALLLDRKFGQELGANKAAGISTKQAAALAALLLGLKKASSLRYVRATHWCILHIPCLR